MKQRVQRFLRRFGEGFVDVVRRHPVELVLVAVSAVWMIAANEANWNFYLRAWMLPLAAVWMLTINTLAGDSAWRWVYRAAWLPLVPLIAWDGLAAWMETQQFGITALILTPLALLLSRRAVDNDRFVDDALVYIRSAVVALLFANVALGLFEAILWSTAYIFGFASERWVEQIGIDALILAEVFFAPLLFLMLRDRWIDVRASRSRVLEVLVNYIVTPALMIYAAILCLYILRIIVTWSLPNGGVAYMVLIFAIVTLVVRGLHERLEKRFGTWFYRAYSLVMLPAALLFWAGVARRVGEYGLTEPRIWLIVCGGLMSLSILLLATGRTGRYYYVALAALVSFAALTYIPPLYPQRLALQNQFRRAERTAVSQGLLAPDGRILRDRFEADDAHLDAYRSLYESLDYIADRDTLLFNRFGITMDELRVAIPDALYDRVVFGYDLHRDRNEGVYFSLSATFGRSVEGVERYRKIYSNLPSWQCDAPAYYDYLDDTLRIRFGDARPPFELAGPVLLGRQMVRSGLSGRVLDEHLAEQYADQLSVYEDGELMILFTDMYFRRQDSLTILKGFTIDAVLTR